MAAKTPWFDDKAETPLLAEYARKLDSFYDAMADGTVTSAELEKQEKLIVSQMKDLEPLLSDEAHAKVTQLLCEVTAHGLMQAMHVAGKSRPKTSFRG